MQAMCPICRHSQRSSIDENLRAGQDLRSLIAGSRRAHPSASVASLLALCTRSSPGHRRRART